MTDDRSAVPGGPEELDDSAGTAVDTTVPHSARIWNYWLGGKDVRAENPVHGSGQHSCSAGVGPGRRP
jgi:S-adenosyl methyltransferase